MKAVVFRIALFLTVARCTESSVLAQSPPSLFGGFRSLPPLSFDPIALPPPATGSPRLPLFGMTSFLQDPLDVEDEDRSSPLDPGPSDEPGFVFALGPYRPNFDMRGLGERKRLGYWKL